MGVTHPSKVIIYVAYVGSGRANFLFVRRTLVYEAELRPVSWGFPILLRPL